MKQPRKRGPYWVRPKVYFADGFNLPFLAMENDPKA